MEQAARRETTGRVFSYVVALGAGLLVAFLSTQARDPLDTFALLVSGTLFAFAALAPPPHGLAVVLASLTVGILGRVHLFSVGSKPFALRPEEAAVAGLWLSGAVRWVELGVGTHAEATRKALVRFTSVAALSSAVAMVRWGPEAVATGTLYLARWAGFGGVLVAGLAAARTPEGRRSLVDGVVGATLALGVLGFVQLLAWPDMEDLQRLLPALGDALIDPHKNRLVSTVLDPNLLGAMLAAGAALVTARALSPDRARAQPALLMLLVLAAAIVLSESRGALLATLVGCTVVVLLARPSLVWGLLAAIPLVVAAGPRVVARLREAVWVEWGTPVQVLGIEIRPERSAYMRVQSWVEALELIRENPIFGVGYNNYGFAAAARGEAFAKNLNGTDSTLLLILATCGPVGLALFVHLLWRAYKAARAAQRVALQSDRELGAGTVGAVAALLVASTFTNALVYPPVLVMLWVLVAAVANAADFE